MIKLTDILKEIHIEDPEGNIIPQSYAEKEFMNKGFKLGQSTIDPETGAVATDVINLPNFDQVRKDILHNRREFQMFRFSSNPDVAKLSKDINTSMTKLANMIFAISKMVELDRRNNG